MAGWSGPKRFAAAAVGLTAALAAPPTVRSATSLPPDANPLVASAESTRLRTQAEADEKAGRWEKALDGYLHIYLSGSPTAELRDRICHCLRQTARYRRHRDPSFQQFVLSLPAADALNVYADAVAKIGTLYVDKDRAAPAKLFASGLDELDRAFDDPAFRWRHTGGSEEKITAFRLALRAAWKARTPADAKDARQVARELVAAAHDEAGVRNPAAVVLELLCGACAGLDEYTAFVPPNAEHTNLAAPTAEFAAYGILVRVEFGELVIDGVVPNSWAALNTTLQKGQRIAQLNGRPLYPATPAVLAEALRIDVAEHEIEVAADSGTIAGELHRLPIPAPTVYGPENVLKGGVGVLRVSAFRETTVRELEDRVLDLRARGMRALVLDLRGNPGGLFPAAVDVAERFLPAGVVVSTQGQAAEFADRSFASDAGPAAWDFPVVLLIDTRTMSAAEVVAVALKDHNRATLVGLPTFGKGFVQTPVRLNTSDGGDGRSGTLILTVASVAGPRGTPLAGGVTPHVIEPEPAKQLDLAMQKAAELIAGR